MSQTEFCGKTSRDGEPEEAAEGEGEDQQEVHEQVQEEDWERQGEGEDEEVQWSFWESQTEVAQQSPGGQHWGEGHQGNADEDDDIEDYDEDEDDENDILNVPCFRCLPWGLQ